MAPKADRETVEALTRATDFDSDTIQALAAVGRPIRIPQGWAVIMEQTPADKAYILLEGSVEIRKHNETIATLSAGDIIGEMALVNKRLRSATVVASTPVKALHFTDEDIATLVEHDPAFATRLQESASERLG